MIHRVLVPLDGSEVSESVLAHLPRLLRNADAEVILLRADYPPPVESYVSITDAVLDVARHYLEGVRARLAAQGFRVRTVARVSSAAGAILQVVREQKVSHVAMATHGRTGFKRLLLGSVAERVIRASPVPVIVVRPGLPPAAPPRNLLVPLDGTDFSSAVLPEAMDLSRRFGARVVLLHVLERVEFGRFRRSSEPSRPDGRERGEERLRRASEWCRQRGIDTLPLLEEGSPPAVILNVCRFNAIDMIAMATHGRSGIPRLMAGSVTERVLRGAAVPVLVVRAAAAARRARTA